MKMEWLVCLGGTAEQTPNLPQEFMSEIRNAPESSPDTITFGSMFNHITSYTSKKVQRKVFGQREQVADCAARFRLACWSFSGPRSEQTWKYCESRAAPEFSNGE